MDVGIAMHLELGPGGWFRRRIGQRLEQALFHFGETFQRHLAGRAVNAVAGLIHDPRMQLTVGVGQITEFAQWQKAVLDVLDSRFDNSLFLGISWRTWIDFERITVCAFGIRALHRRFVDAGFGDRAFGVVDNYTGYPTAEPLEGAPVATQPGRYRLIAHRSEEHTSELQSLRHLVC